MKLEEYLAATEKNLDRMLADRGLFNQTYQLQSKSLLTALSPEDVSSIHYDYRAERVTRNSLYAFEAATRLLLNGHDIGRFSDGLRRLAQTFEHLGDLREGPAPDISRLLAAGLYQLAGYEANATCLVRLISLPEIPLEASPQAFTALLHRWVNLALQRRFVMLALETRRSRQATSPDDQSLAKTLESSDLHTDALLVGVQLRLIRQLFDGLCRYALQGDLTGIQAFNSSLEQLYDVLMHTGQADESLMLKILECYKETIVRNSVWRYFYAQMDTDPLWHRYGMLLARGTQANLLEARSTIELWKSQREAVEKALLGTLQAGFVIRMPTSAGKTRIAELAVMQTINYALDTHKVVYVAPFRALSDEVERNLSATFSDLGFSVSSVLGSFEMDDFQEYLLHETDLLITTPEKLNLLSRAQPEFFANVRLLVLDEGHVVGDLERGAKYEFLLTRLRSKMLPDSQVIFISAVLPEINTSQFAEWLCRDRDAVVSTDWRPARQRLGLFTWRGNSGQITYAEEEAAAGNQAPFVPRVISVRPYRDFTPKLRRDKLVYFPEKTKGQTAAELAIRFAELGPVLLFAPRPDWAESCARAIQRGLQLRRQTNPDALPPVFLSAQEKVGTANSMEVATSWLGSDHPITNLLRQGIGIHHRGLPEALRRSVEDDFRSGTFPVLVATNTLGQGVNLPIKTVVVHSVARYRQGEEEGEGEMEPISQRDFWNICGRAGRAGAETEGQVIFVALNAEDEQRFNVYALRSYEPIEGRLFEMLRELTAGRLSDDDLARQIDSELAAILVEESIGTSVQERLENILGTSLVSIQARDNKLDVDNLIRPSVRVMESLKSRITDESLLKIYSLTGLRIASCEQLARSWQDDSEAARLTLQDPSSSIEGTAILLYRTIAALPEMEPQYPFEADHEALLIDWIKGTPVSELTEQYAPSESESLRFIRFIEDYFGYRLPWGMSGALRIAQHILGIEDLPFMQKYVSSMVKYGVDHPVSTWLMNIGCPSRELARDIAISFIADNPTATNFSTFIEWFSNLSEEDLVLRLGASSNQAQGLLQRGRSLVPDRRDFVASVRTPSTVMHGRLVGTQYDGRSVHAARLTPGDPVELRRDYGNPYDRNAIGVYSAGTQVGYIDRRLARLLATELDCGIEYTATVSQVRHGTVIGVELELSR